jgi:hypothetical protein
VVLTGPRSGEAQKRVYRTESQLTASFEARKDKSGRKVYEPLCRSLVFFFYLVDRLLFDLPLNGMCNVVHGRRALLLNGVAPT